ncbi:MAG: CDP-diacylglycerol--glycerol-3-phosphate 3-phosphatidyltransferase [Thermodesulfovibrionales bacterium]|nr:CDP-diacylglycerol--glycerol-3-phosphate 3-phosphatidyltransferase [Thermodesulfovibrionales bacterium]
MNILNFPNTLTFIRILIIPFFISCLLNEKYFYALILFVIAAMTDLFDGLLARLTNQKTKIGAFLDPLADKILLVTAFIFLNTYDWLPDWILITVISRDFIVVIGWCLLVILIQNKKVEPSLAGKLANALQAILIIYVLFSINFKIEDTIIAYSILFLTAFFTVFSGVQYIYKGYKRLYERVVKYNS